MNITNTINKDNYDSLKTQNEIMNQLGFDLFNRKIYFFIKESKNLYNIEGNNIVNKIGCLITNRSVFSKNGHRDYNKTVYLCDVEFPKEYNIETIKSNFDKFINVATINPLYAFANNHIINTKTNTFINIGLSMVDLSVSDRNSFGVINFSNNDNSDPVFKEIVYGNEYNPKYYNRFDAELNKDSHDTRNGNVEDFMDNRTKVLCNKYGSENVDNFINGSKQEGIFIDKRTMFVNEFINSFFNKYMFLHFDDIEIIYNSTLDKPLNIRKLNTFTKFDNEAITYYLDQLMSDIETCISILKNDLKEDFYMVFSITDQFVICDIHFFKDMRELRITKPLYKLYGEFALDSEQILNDVETSAEIAKYDMLEQVSRNVQSLEFVKDISGAISLIENATKAIQMSIIDNKCNVEKLIGGSTLSLEDVREKYQSNRNN